MGLEHCTVCHKPYRAGNKSARNMYCSAACRQVAYRARKKQSTLAKTHTLEIEDWLIQKWLIQNGREGTDVLLASFFKHYGKEPYVFMLRTLLSAGLAQMAVAS